VNGGPKVLATASRKAEIDLTAGALMVDLLANEGGVVRLTIISGHAPSLARVPGIGSTWIMTSLT